jgi:hypothetical protein
MTVIRDANRRWLEFEYLGLEFEYLLSPEFVRAFMSMRLRADCRASRLTMRQKTFDVAAGLPIDFGLAAHHAGLSGKGDA